jgi:hypothetical protein
MGLPAPEIPPIPTNLMSLHADRMLLRQVGD